MDNQEKGNVKKSMNDAQSHIKQAAADLLNDGKKLASAIYEDGAVKVNEAEDNIKEYSDEILRKVQQNPLASVLIAGGVGFLLSMLLKK